MTIRIDKSSEASTLRTSAMVFMFCLFIVPAVFGKSGQPGQSALQRFANSVLAVQSSSLESTAIAKSFIESPSIERPYLQPGEALPQDFLQAICTDQHWREYAVSRGGEHHYKNLCLQRLKKQEKRKSGRKKLTN